MSLNYEPSSEPIHISAKLPSQANVFCGEHPVVQILKLERARVLASGSWWPLPRPPTPAAPLQAPHPGGNLGANLKSISHRCYLFEVAFVWELTKETIHLPLGCLQGGCVSAWTVLFVPTNALLAGSQG